MFNRRKKDFIGALKEVLDTESGQKLFKYLTQDYVDGTSLQPAVELTYYKMGQKELIQGLLQDAELTEDQLKLVTTVNTYEE